MAMIPLVIKPAHSAPALLHALQQAGHQPHYAELMSYQPMPVPDFWQHAATAQHIIAVSAEAVRCAAAAVANQHQRWPNTRYYAVGTSTAKAFALQGITATTPEVMSSEGLLALPDLAAEQVRGTTILILRGDGGREYLKETLETRGALLHYANLYRRFYHHLEGYALWQQWQIQQIDSIIITSGELLTHLWYLLTPFGHNWLANCWIVLPSERLVQQATQLGLRNTLLATNATNPALVAALTSRSPT